MPKVLLQNPNGILRRPMDRRRFFASVVNLLVTAVASLTAVIAGGAVLSGALARRRESWAPAARFGDLDEEVPLTATLRVVRDDGYRQVVDREVVFLFRQGEAGVRVLGSTCTHLGCRVSWDIESQRFNCPCHGGVFDPNGAVIAGPPPRPLPRLAARIDGEQVHVQL